MSCVVLALTSYTIYAAPAQLPAKGEPRPENYQQVLHLPGHPELGAVAWSVWDEAGPGYLGQIEIFDLGRQVTHRVLWNSTLDSAYNPKLQILPHAQSDGLPVLLASWNYGAAAASMKLIGRVNGRFHLLDELDGVAFELLEMKPGKPPLILAHQDPTYFDVPILWKWNHGRIVNVSQRHPEFFHSLLLKDRDEFSQDLSSTALVNLGRIARLAGEAAEARTYLERALKLERARDKQAIPEIIRDAKAELLKLPKP